MAKKKKGGAGADKAAQEERLLELQKKLDDAETTLEEARKESEKMSRDKAGLLHQLATLEQTLVNNQEHNSATIATLEGEREQLAAEKGGTLASMGAYKRELEQNLNSNAVVEGENARLHQEMARVEADLTNDTASNEADEERLKQEAFNMRMQLENMSRKTLKELNVEYERKAFAAMQLESSQANDQNLSLQNDLRDNSLQVSALMANHQEKYVALRKMRLERDLLMSATALQETRLETLEDAKADHEEIIAETQTQIAELHAHNKELQNDARHFSAALEDLRDLEQRRAAVQSETARFKALSLKLTRAILSSKELGEPRRADAPQVEAAAGDSSPVSMMTPLDAGVGAGVGGGDAVDQELLLWSSSHVSNESIQWQ
mmetsp:Transcript_31726/g.83829  ORF Transcript_31726/g.83829 Transcript_31726/m.83829 type:complete len:378 (+) Transcript_31726:220-1353(+)